MKKANSDIKNKAFFDEETHKYFNKEEDYEKFLEAKEKYMEQNPDKSIAKWATMQSWRYNAIKTTTKILSEAFPFTGGDDSITKSWLSKINKKGNLDNETLDILIKGIDKIREYLDNDLKLSQTLGTEAHKLIQKHIETFRSSEIMNMTNITNEYFLLFKEQLETPETDIYKLFNKVELILPYEIPTFYKDEERETILFSGMWDGLYRLSNGEYIILDIKTGSELKYDKLLKVEHQMNAYNLLVKQNLDIKVDYHYSLEISKVWDKNEEQFINKIKFHKFKPKPLSFLTLINGLEQLNKIKGLKD